MFFFSKTFWLDLLSITVQYLFTFSKSKVALHLECSSYTSKLGLTYSSTETAAVLLSFEETNVVTRDNGTVPTVQKSLAETVESCSTN